MNNEREREREREEQTFIRAQIFSFTADNAPLGQSFKYLYMSAQLNNV